MHNIEKSFRDIIDKQKVGFPLSRSLSGDEENTPKLRFPGFASTGSATGWVEKRLGEVINAKSKKIASKPTTITYKCIDLEHLSRGTGLLLGYVEASNLGSSKNVFSKGDVLFGKLRPYLRKYTIAPFDGVCSSEILVLKGIGILNEFLYFIIQTDNFISLANQSTGSKMPRADWTVLELNPVFIPTLPEQQKIADFLTEVDNKIQSLTQKKEALSQYKKGLLQKLFPKAGETVPELRFSGFSEPWVEKRIKDFGYFYYGKSAPKWSIKKEAKTPCIRYGELYTKFNVVVDKIYSYTNISTENLKFSKGGEVLVPRVGEDPKDFAKCCYLPFKDVAIGEMISVFNTKENGLFISYYFNTLYKEFGKMVEGASVSNLYFRYLEKIRLHLPSLPEQQKIAAFLTTVDNKITQVEQQLETMTQFKKGLLQQMFV